MTKTRTRGLLCRYFRKDSWVESAVGGQAEWLKISSEAREAAVEGKALAGFPAGEFGDPVFHGKAKSEFQRSEPDARRHSLGIELLAKKDVRENPFTVEVGMGVDKAAEFLGLETTTAVAHPVRAGFQPSFLPRSADIVIIQESRIPEMKVDGKAVRFDMHQKGGRKIPVEFEGLKSLSLILVGGRDLDEFPGVRDGGLASCKMPDGAEFDSRTDMIDHPGGKIRTFFRVVDQQGDLGEADFFGGILEKDLMPASPNSAQLGPEAHARRCFGWGRLFRSTKSWGRPVAFLLARRD